MKKRTGVFVNVSELYYNINRKWGRKLNYLKYLRKIESEGYRVHRAIAYGIQQENEAIGFISCLKHFGFEPKYKNNDFDWSVGMAVDVVRMLSKLDAVVLGTSNRSILPLIEWVKNHGSQCIIFACEITQDLKDACDKYFLITEDFLEEKGKKTMETCAYCGKPIGRTFDTPSGPQSQNAMSYTDTEGEMYCSTECMTADKSGEPTKREPDDPNTHA